MEEATSEGRLHTEKMRVKIIKNAVRCNFCGDVIESTYRHDYVTCSCGRVSVDGGHDYLRRCFASPDAFTELSITETLEEEKSKEKGPR